MLRILFALATFAAVLRVSSCVLIPQPPKPTTAEQVNSILGNFFDGVQQIIEASK